MKTELQCRKTDSSYTKDINRLTEYANTITKSNKLRKYLIQQYNLFVKKLLNEKRITKEELEPFFHKKEQVVKIIKTEEAVGQLGIKKNSIISTMQAETIKEQKCLHEAFNSHLIESGQCETIEEAEKIPRHLSCMCKKCKQDIM